MTKKFKDIKESSGGLTAAECLGVLTSMAPEDVHQLFYPGTKPRLNRAMQAYEKVYEAITRRNGRYTQYKLYFRRWQKANHLPTDFTMAINCTR